MLIIVKILGAVALLLWGLRMVRNGVMSAYGPIIKREARSSEGKKLAPFLAGFFAAMALQSSTATAMIAASFTTKRVISAFTAFAIILGADLGTAIISIIASQKIEFLPPALIAIGIFGFLNSESAKSRGILRAVGGVGIVLLSLSLISRASAEVTGGAGSTVVIGLLSDLPVLAVIFGVVFTYLAHSSLAIVLLSVGLVTSNSIDTSTAVYLVLGANFGSSLLPYIANMSGPKASKSPLMASMILRGLMAAILFLVWPSMPTLWLEQFPASYVPLTAHVALNVAVVIVGFLSAYHILRFSSFLLPDDAADDEKVYPRYLDHADIASPAKALASAKREALVMAEIAQSMLERSHDILKGQGPSDETLLSKMDDDLDRLFDAIKLYVAAILHRELDDDETRRAMDLLSFTANMEHVGDIIDGNLMTIAARKSKNLVEFSPEGSDEISAFYERVLENFQLAVNTFLSDDRELARQLYEAKTTVRELEQDSISTHMERLGSGVSKSLQTSSLHIDIIRDLKRINSHLTAVAYPVLRASGEVPKTKWKKRGQKNK